MILMLNSGHGLSLTMTVEHLEFGVVYISQIQLQLEGKLDLRLVNLLMTLLCLTLMEQSRIIIEMIYSLNLTVEVIFFQNNYP